MSSLTRDLFPMAVSRNSGEYVEVVLETSIPKLDGSFNVIDRTVPYMARMADLTPDQIQRLQSGGITIHSGASIAIPFEFEQSPDMASYGGAVYKIVESTISEGCSIFVVDKAPIGFSNVEATA